MEHDYLEVKATDSADLRASKTYWRMVMSLKPAERKIFLQKEQIKSEEYWLNFLIDWRKRARTDKILEPAPTLEEIREQRRIIQWQRAKLNKLINASNTKPSAP